jgi:hypothetical protein
MKLNRRIILISGGLIAILAIAAGVFMLRAPVLLVTDDEFIGLYGLLRSREKQIEASIKLFRQVKAVRIAEGAAPDVVAFAVDAAAAKPYGVLFPYRYYDGARHYARQFPEYAVAVLGGGMQPRPDKDGMVFIKTDRETDFFQAGRCAAVYTLRNDGNILFFPGKLVTPAERTAFIAGLREQGVEKSPLFINNAENFPMDTLSCVIMTGAAASYPDRDDSTPVLLFSWIDPALTSRKIQIIFDDSPWALAVEAVKMLSSGADPAPVPSKIAAFKKRIPDPGIWRSLNQIIQNKVPYRR